MSDKNIHLQLVGQMSVLMGTIFGLTGVIGMIWRKAAMFGWPMAACVVLMVIGLEAFGRMRREPQGEEAEA